MFKKKNKKIKLEKKTGVKEAWKDQLFSEFSLEKPSQDKQMNK